MNGALLASLDRLRERAAAVAAVADDAVTVRRAEATDQTGAVTARLGPDGIPTALQVAPDWARRLRPEEFGPAVTGACRAAVAQQTAEWSRRLEGAGWPRGGDAVTRPVRSTRLPDTAIGRPARPPGPPRPVPELGRETRAALHDAPRPGGHTGSAQGGRLALTLTAGAVTCVADPRWVAGRTAGELTGALAEALHLLHAARDADRRTLDALLTEAMAALTALAAPS
jgi:hypothetical protein